MLLHNYAVHQKPIPIVSLSFISFSLCCTTRSLYLCHSYPYHYAVSPEAYISPLYLCHSYPTHYAVPPEKPIYLSPLYLCHSYPSHYAVPPEVYPHIVSLSFMSYAVPPEAYPQPIVCVRVACISVPKCPDSNLFLLHL